MNTEKVIEMLKDVLREVEQLHESKANYKDQILEDISIGELALPCKIFSLLARNGIHNLLDLRNSHTNEHILNIVGLGKKTFNDIRVQCAKKGLEL